MEKQFVPYEIALKLRDLGYNEISLFCYDTAYENNPLSNCPHLLLNSELGGFENKPISAPLWQQAFDWFREKGYIIQLNIFDSYDRGDGYEEEGYYFKISDYDGWRGGLRDTYKGESYGTIEQAKLVCLEKLIEIVENDTL